MHLATSILHRSQLRLWLLLGSWNQSPEQDIQDEKSDSERLQCPDAKLLHVSGRSRAW